MTIQKDCSMLQPKSLFKYEFNYNSIIEANNNAQVPLWHFSLVDQNNIAKIGVYYLDWASASGELHFFE